ncbi:hypothetical protein IWX90DRAFT_486658 [Phyllosticta citrichinensis]|uniref:F-box domain-containing protein n=1 Tax=Phyllosticta citrichinensis TaxID=1130410 RepID=A0ABR1XU37_9PEZI
MTPMSGSINMALPKAFQIMPVELNQEIAHYLDEDKDVASFRASCRRARDSIDDQDSFWHKRFGMVYDHNRRLAYGPGINTSLRKAYQVRKDVLRDGVCFSKGKTKKERDAIAVLIDMIRESFEGGYFDDANGLTSCGNLKEICSFAKRSNLLDSIFCGRSKMTHNGKVVDFRLNQDLVAIQLMLAPLILNPKDYRRPLNFADSQKVVYSNDGLMTMWKNGTLELNLEWLLHMLNFFKFHMVGDDNTLKDPMSELDSKQMPQFWKRKLTNAPMPLGRRWMGTYAYLDREEMVQLRRGNVDRNLFMDKNVDHGEGAIQTLRIDFDGPMDFEWPELFEDHLESQTLPPPHTHSRVQHRAHTDHDGEASRSTNDGFKSHRFQARGFDDEDFFGTGWVNQLPAQRGIPGWQRITMMKYFKDDEDDGGFDTTALWAYEGVVLPGGQVILGRWWSPEVGVPDEEKYSGPFIFWNVDESDAPLLGVDEQEEEDEE